MVSWVNCSGVWSGDSEEFLLRSLISLIGRAVVEQSGLEHY